MTVYFPLELIGEEIYDEFDPEGAYGDRSPYESPAPAGTRNSNGGGPEHPHRPSSTSRQRTQSDINDQVKSANVLPTSLKSLGFFRARSAPPVPRETEADKHVGNDKVTGREWEIMDDEKDFLSESDLGHPTVDKGNMAIQIPKPIKGTGRYPPSVILEQHSTISSYDSAVPAVVSVEAKGLTVPPSTYQNPSLMVTAPAPTRFMPSGLLSVPQSTQAAPPTISTPTLEAVLLERKRRLASTNASISSSPASFGPHNNILPSPVVSAGSFGLNSSVPGSSVLLPSATSGVPLTLRGVHSSSGKGTMFKSSPLAGGDRAVSERARAAKDAQSPGQEQGGE